MDGSHLRMLRCFGTLTEIGKVGTYTYFPGGGLVVTTKTGKEYKIAFKHKKDFNVVYPYLTEYLATH